MSGFGWHPREHRKALDGMLALTLEERGAYNTVLDLIYDREGPIPDDARWLAGWMGVSIRKWSSLRSALIEAGKIFAVNVNGIDCLMNRRAAIELENQTKLSRKLSESGAKGGRKSAETKAKANENNEEPVARLPARLKLMTETGTEGSETKVSGGEPPHDPDKEAWTEGPVILVSQGGMSLEAARKFFGKLLATNGLQPRDLLGAIGEAKANCTMDPQAWFTKAAAARQRRQTGPPKRVGFV